MRFNFQEPDDTPENHEDLQLRKCRFGGSLLLPFHVSTDKIDSSGAIEKKEIDPPYIISKDLLAGPKVRIAPHALPSQRSTPANSVEGRSVLHHYVKLFRENYVEYACSQGEKQVI